MPTSAQVALPNRRSGRRSCCALSAALVRCAGSALPSSTVRCSPPSATSSSSLPPRTLLDVLLVLQDRAERGVHAPPAAGRAASSATSAAAQSSVSATPGTL